MPDRLPRVVCNTTPLIALSLIERLDLLEKLYGQVMIPSAVEAELLAGGHSKIGIAQIKNATFITVIPLMDPLRATLLSDLDRGEAEVLALALEQEADLVIIDERLARLHAARLGLNLTGTVGILVRAKREGLINEVRPYLDSLVTGGIYLGESLIDHVLTLTGER